MFVRDISKQQKYFDSGYFLCGISAFPPKKKNSILIKILQLKSNNVLFSFNLSLECEE